MSQLIRLGISTCPNDTFAFHGLMNRDVDWQGLEFQIELLDIQLLNDGLFANRFDVAKTSFHAALLLSDRYVVLPSGSALGFGVGPLLLAAQPGQSPSDPGQRVLCPGRHTTATLLFNLFYPNTATVQHAVFSEIMPALQSRKADFGVCIHEGRFTWQDEGLALVEDLGTRWEAETSCPLPLGGLVASRNLSRETMSVAQSVIQASILFARENPESTIPTMRKYAQEFDDEVLMKHVSLYVNDWTVDLGDEGSRSLQQLSSQAKSVGLIDECQPSLEIFKP